MNIKGYSKKTTPVGVFAVLLIVLMVLAYYVSGIFKAENLELSMLQTILADVFKHPLRNYWNTHTIACMGIGFLLWVLFVSYYLTYYRNYQDGIENGSGEWLDVAKANQQLCDKNDKDNRILSQNLKVSLNKLSNNNMLIIGSSGSFKTTSVMHQNLLQFGSAYVVLDVKGDTQRKLGEKMKEAGYTVRSLNLKTPEKSDRYNPFEYIETEYDLLRVIKALHDAVRKPNAASSADPFWDDGVNLYLQALFYYEWLEARENGKKGDMNNILKLINYENQLSEDGETSRLEVMMNEKAIQFGEEYPPVRDYRKLKEGAPDTVRSIVIMVNAMLAIAETAEVKRIFSGNDINMREIGTGVGGDPNKKIVLFLIIPDNNQVYNFIISMFYTQLFDILIRLSDDELKQPLPVRVEVWMDEFYAGARPADTDILLGVVRSRNISMIPVLQSISQIKTLFKDDKWEIMMDNLAMVVYLGSGPLAETTHKYISESLGKATIDVRTDNIHKGHSGNTGLNFQRQARELMTPDEVKQLPADHEIIFLENRPPIIDYKAIPFDKPEIGYKSPAWLKNRYTDAFSKGDYDHPVYAIYDSENFRYITVNREKPLQFLSDEEAEHYRAAAKMDPHMHMYSVAEKDLLYINFEDATRKSQEEIEAMLKSIIRRENINYAKIRELMLLQDDPQNMVAPVDKSGWVRYDSFIENIKAYFDMLPLPDQEEICLAMDSNLTEKQLNNLIFMDYSNMKKWHQAYRIENK